jgi:hypothetical protein
MNSKYFKKITIGHLTIYTFMLDQIDADLDEEEGLHEAIAKVKSLKSRVMPDGRRQADGVCEGNRGNRRRRRS